MHLGEGDDGGRYEEWREGKLSLDERRISFQLKKNNVNVQLPCSVLPAHSIINLLLKLVFYQRPHISVRFSQRFLPVSLSPIGN